MHDVRKDESSGPKWDIELDLNASDEENGTREDGFGAVALL